ncbi:MAG: hemolysin III family protein [Lentisphaeria bacterium]|nr:hemolysin III family protein [Lentisphaeria bacterium]
MTDLSPNYSQAEDICNSVSHIVGAVLTVYGTYQLILNSALPSFIVCALIYGVAIFSMFLVSSVYHAIRDQEVKSAVRKADHAVIYFAIAGTYVPILNAIAAPRECLIWFCSLGACAVIGGVFSFITLKHRYVTTIVYLVMGWASLLLLKNLWTVADPMVTYYLIGGGVAFSIGALLYLIKKPFVHTVFHIFVLAGVILQYLSIKMLYS